jgi:hypothetical protein
MTVREEPQRNANGAYLCATCCPPMNTPGFEASMTVGEEPQRNANGAYLCATCCCSQLEIRRGT